MSAHGGVFGKTSEANLLRVHPALVRIARSVARFWNCTITGGKRDLETQKHNVLIGVSETMDSKHLPRDEDGNIDWDNGLAWAIDIIPYPTNWELVQKGMNALRAADPSMQLAKMYFFAGFVQGVAHEQGTAVRSGMDWNSDGEVGDHTFIDLPHHELQPKGTA